MTSRRTVLIAAPALAATAGQAAAQPAYETPKLDLVMTIHVQIGPVEQIGDIPVGGARYISITGGTFDGPRLKGAVLPGGADWQYTRPDGVTVLRAHYGLKTGDGKIIQIHNNCLAHQTAAGARLIRSTLTFEAPAPYDWLNKSVFVGTLNAPGDARAPVVIRVFQAS